MDPVPRLTISLFDSILHYGDSPINYKLYSEINYWQYS